MTRNERIELENRILSVGREFLPAFAIAVLDGGCPTAKYDQWLQDQMDQMLSEDPPHDEDADGCNCRQCLEKSPGSSFYPAD